MQGPPPPPFMTHLPPLSNHHLASSGRMWEEQMSAAAASPPDAEDEDFDAEPDNDQVKEGGDANSFKYVTIWTGMKSRVDTPTH